MEQQFYQPETKILHSEQNPIKQNMNIICETRIPPKKTNTQNNDSINQNKKELLRQKQEHYALNNDSVKQTEVGIANFFFSPLIANLLIFFGVR
jgi:hypothetical protein